MEANQAATQLLLKGHDVDGLPGWDGGRSQTIHYIDWEHPTTTRSAPSTSSGSIRRAGPGLHHPRRRPAGQRHPAGRHRVQSPSVSEPMAEAIDQLRRYSNQRKAAGEVEDNEGNERLFVTNQILVATSFDEAQVGTIGADVEHYAPLA